MQVTKRDGNVEDFNIEKIHKVIMWAIDGINDVSISDIELNAKLSLQSGISTREIHQLLIKSANNLISEDSPNYQFVASRLALYAIRKDVWGSSEPPRLYEHIVKCVNSYHIYDPMILSHYCESEIHKLGKYIKHNRDENFTYAGIQQTIDKYLIKNRNTGEVYETPQFAYMLIAMTCFSKYPKDTRLSYVKRLYDHLSQFKISLPTPIMSGVRTNIKQYASCILIDVDDSLESIFSSNTAMGYYTARRAGIGSNVGRIRPINSVIRNGEVVHTGLIPFLKMFQSTVKSTSQNGIRGGGCTISVPFFHPEILDVIVLKNNAGTDDNRVKSMDYCIQFSKIFYQRLIDNSDITLFSSHECKDLYDVFGMPEFDTLYEEKEKDKTLKFRKTIKARELAELFVRERLETGRIYLMNIDHCNSHGSFKQQVNMTNLCVEVIFPTVPLKHIDDEEAEIGVCILSALNLLEVKKEEMPDVCDIIVRMLDELIDYQDYCVKAAERFCKNKRALGIGFTNLAGLLANNKIGYDSNEALLLVDEYSELLQYHLLDASTNLAKEKGCCIDYSQTKYSDGQLPIDTYKTDVDSVVTREKSLDWELLRGKIKEFGLRNTTLTCQMPCESSSVIQNSTNGVEPVRDLISYKKSKTGVLKQVVPNIAKRGKYYTKAFDITSNSHLTNITAVIQKWMDMSISMNHYYNYTHYDGGNIPLSTLIKDMIYAYKMGIKTMYYCNTPDGSADMSASCESGACAI